MPKKPSSQQHTRKALPQRPEYHPRWQGTQQCHGRSMIAKTVTNTLAYPDTAAEVAWRQRRPPHFTLNIPRRFIRKGEHQAYRDIAESHGAFVAPYEDEGFGIWADNAFQALQARDAIEIWIKTKLKDYTEGSNFADLRSMTPAEKEKAETRWQNEVQRHLFRQCPPIGKCFQAIGTFSWPSNEVKTKEVLGNSLEALDPIRRSSACYIIEGEDDTQIKILGDIKGVQSAILKIRRTFFQVVAHQQKPEGAYFWHWDSDAGSPERILTSDASSTAVNGISFHVDDWSFEQSDIPGKSLAAIRDRIMSTIAGLVYYKGKISFRARLGSFQALSYLSSEDGSYAPKDFWSMTAQSQFAGKTVSQLRVRDHEDAMLGSIRNSQELSSLGAATDDTGLAHPTYTATFIFDTPKDGVHELIVTWQINVDDNGKEVPARLPDQWARLDSRAHTCLLDLHLDRLDKGFAWHFDMNVVQPAASTRLPDILKSFASRVAFVPSKSRKHKEPFANFTPITGSGLVTISYTAARTFPFQDGDWLVDVADKQTVEHPHARSPSQTVACQSFQRQLSVRHRVWDAHFSENAALGVGQAVAWAASEDKWFPKSDESSGFDTFAEKLSFLEDCIAQSAADDFTGMTVG